MHDITLQGKEGQTTQLMQVQIMRDTAAKKKYEHAKRKKSKGVGNKTRREEKFTRKKKGKDRVS